MVYSANTKQNGIFGYINFFDFDTECIQITTNGVYAGTVFYRKKHKFSINGDARLLIKKYENLDYLYLLKTLQDTFAEHNFNWENKPTVNKIKDIVIKIPIDSNGNFDLNTQREIAGKFSCVSELKTKIESYKKQIEELNIKVSEDYNFKTEIIDNLFRIEKGKSIYTNEFIVKNPGEFPLYSSQTTDDGIIGNINIFDYDCNAITWTTDGVHAGTTFLRNGKFSMTTHCGALIPKSNAKNVLLSYIYSFLKNNLKQYAVGEQNKRVTTTIIKPIEIPIPITSNGDFDLSAQKENTEK